MNKIQTYEGGQPLYLGDLNFMQDALLESFKGILSGMGDQGANVILSGCEVTVKVAVNGIHTVTWTDGFVGIAGEVYRVKAGAIQANVDFVDLYWCVKKVYEVEGKYTFEDGSEHDCHELCEVTLSNTKTGIEVYASYLNTKTVNAMLLERLMGKYAEVMKWKTVMFMGNEKVTGSIQFGYNEEFCFYKGNVTVLASTTLMSTGNAAVKKLCDVNLSGLTQEEQEQFWVPLGLVAMSLFSFSGTKAINPYLISVSKSMTVYNISGEAPDSIPAGSFNFNVQTKR